MIEKPIRKYLKQKDYQKHKILRRIKKRDQRRKEAASKIAERALRKKLKLPAFDDGKDEDELLIGGYVAPELIVTPEGNAFRTTESGQPAVSTGALLEAGIPIRRKSKELKNNQKLLGHDEYLAQQAAADEIANARTGGLNEMFADLLTAGFASLMAKGGEQLRNGDYVRGAINMASPLMLGSGVAGDAARALFGGWHLADDDGVRKTWNHLLNGEYGRAALSGTGDLLNAAMLAYGVNQLGRAARPVWDAGKEAVYNVADRYMFMPRKDSFTRGIGGETGLQDLVESGLVRGNPVGTEITAKAYGKLTRSNRNNFNDIMRDTGLKDIEHRFYNRTLTEEDFNAIKKAALKYKTENPSLGSQNKITLLRPAVDPLSRYSSYQDYQAKLASDRQTLANATSLDDSGQPLAYFYDDGRNPLTAGHDYARSDYGVRINNASRYNPRIFSGHLHYSMPEAVSLRDPNVEIFKKGPLGLTIKLDKKTLQPVWKRDLSNMFRIRYGLIPFGTGLTGYGLYNSVTDPIISSYNKGKDPIHIKPSKRGTFTAAAKKRGMGVLLFASKVLKNPSNYSSAMRKKALFAKNATKFKH